jgi:tetratricopeptide (TPR) repeat protein
MAKIGESIRTAQARVHIAAIRLRDRVRSSKPWTFARRRPALAAVVAAVVLAAAGGAAAMAVHGAPEVPFLAPRTISDLRAEAKANPKDAAAQVELGHAQFASGRRLPALSSYDRALRLDRSSEDGEMAKNLVACFGTAQQDEAEAIIRRYKVVATAPELDPLVRSKRPSVRWGALKTLDALGKASRSDWAAAYVLDLESSDCDVRRRAVEKLEKIGDKSALPAIRKANAADEKTGGFLRSKCLGDRPEHAERAILARR